MFYFYFILFIYVLFLFYFVHLCFIYVLFCSFMFYFCFSSVLVPFYFRFISVLFPFYFRFISVLFLFIWLIGTLINWKKNLTSGILLHGGPGSGKTHLALGLASAAGVNKFYVAGPQLYSRWLGETERKVVCFYSISLFLSLPHLLLYFLPPTTENTYQ
jgi:ATPase family associated with various cellular activities (AAA)